jgi:hypothetical protein
MLGTAILAFGGCTAVMAAQMSATETPAAVTPPAGHKPVMTLKGAGLLTYECRAKQSEGFEWAFAGPDAGLWDSMGKQVGKYYGGPTWEHADGSKVTGKQLAVAPGAAGSIPLQLVQASPAMGEGAFTGVSYIQRVNTMGGVAPSTSCDASTLNSKTTVKYSADYVFYKP